jgi:protein-tyrosine phosphatase
MEECLVDWITLQKIAIGNYLDAQNAALLKEAGIRSILCLDGCLVDQSPQSLGVEEIKVVKLQDTIGNDPRVFARAVGTLAELVRSHCPVLVHCHAGQSRSVIVVAGFLMVDAGMDAAAAMAYVGHRRVINVTPGLERLLDTL